MMKVDLSKPIHTSLLVIGVSFLVSVCILYLINPILVQKIDQHGKVIRDWKLIFFYSSTTAFTCGVLALLYCCKNREIIPVIPKVPVLPKFPLTKESET